MKKKYIIGIGVLLLLFLICLFLCPGKTKIAVVDVNQIVGSYPKFSLVQRENNLKVGELSQWLDAAQKKIDGEKDKATRAKLIQETQAAAKQRKLAIQQEYKEQMNAVNIEIEQIVKDVAKKNGCSIVFSTISVVTGGLNITDQVLKKFEEEKK